MALYVYVTDECKEDARTHSRYDEMIRLKERVESTQLTCHFDNFPPSNYMKKRFDRQIRLVADRRTILVEHEEHVVMTFLRTFVRGGKDYERFIKDPDGFGNRFLHPLVSDDFLRDHLLTRLRDHPVPPKAPPSELENHFLYRFLGSDAHRSTEEFVCESEHWVNSLSDRRIKDRLVLLCQDLAKMADKKPTETVQGHGEYPILCRWFPALDKLFLAGIAHGDAREAELSRVYAHILSRPADEVTEEDLLRSSVRTYPTILLADEDAWMNIQKDVEANLALSPEETDVLETVHSSDGGYPIFINGRAGSGKSTILYYLFADYVNLYLELRADNESLKPPLLLSCSDDLRRQAEKTVANLIRCNPRWRSEGGDIPDVPGDCFQEFQTFLRTLLSEEQRVCRFDQTKRIDFSRFRRMWENQFVKNKRVRKLGPDLSWHVIRTYIKGTNSEDYLDPEDYHYLPRKQKSVSQEAFSTVHESVWEAWYRGLCEQEGFWDDQDLARHLFTCDLPEPLFPVVFCDEAQDFTRVELDLIFRLCLFTNRSLRHEDVNRVPFAFAGDPFQTLNPTGFRWDAIQALYHDKLVDTLGENLHKPIDLNYQELSLNYRSTRNIVRLCNLIQAYRAAVFAIPTLQPQQSWQKEEASPAPVWFDRNETGKWSQLRDEQDVTIIVPCMLNEEQDFVQEDEYLRGVVRTDDVGTPVNVLSPARAKGLEFGRVVLYGFADKEPERLFASLEDDDADEDSLLPFEYFVNQLYVAASRPKRRLFIIDSQKGRDSFWKIANDESLQQKLWNRLARGKEIWAPHIGGFEIGTAESWSEDRGDQGENARLFKQQGLTKRDPFLLRSAAVSYENLANKTEALECRAYALEFEEKFLEAGSHFRKAQKPTEALRCYWKGGVGAKEQVLELHKLYPDIGNEFEYRLMAVLNEPSSKSIILSITDLAQRAQENDSLRLRLSKEATFNEVVWRFAEALLSDGCTSEGIAQFLSACEALLKMGLPRLSGVLAEMYFKAGDYAKAVEQWESVEGFHASPSYAKAKAILLTEALEKNPTLELAPNEVVMLVEHLSDQGRFLLAARCLQEASKPKDLIDFLGRVPLDFEDWQELWKLTMEALGRRDEWGVICDLAKMSRGRKAPRYPKKVRTATESKATELRNALVATCATLPGFQHVNNAIRKQYSDYFRESLLSSPQWHDDLTLQAVGAAIERAGRQVDALKFYEQIIDSRAFRRREREFAQKRWVATKEKQAKRVSEEGDESSAKRYSREASEKRRLYGLTGVDIPDLPVVSVDSIWIEKRRETSEGGATTSVSSAGTEEAEATPYEQTDGFVASTNTVFEINRMKFEFCPTQARVNITNTATMHTANIRGDVRELRSTDVQIARNGEAFVCDSWESECHFSERDGTPLAIFHLTPLGVSVAFELGTQGTR